MVPILLLAKIRTPTFYRTLSQHALPTSYNQAVFLLTDMVVNSRYIDTSTGSGTLLVIDEHRPLTHSDFSLCISAQTFKHLKTLLCWTSDCLPLVLKILKFFCVPSMSLKHPYFCNICQKRMWQSLAAVFYLTPSGRSTRSSLNSRQVDVSGLWCHRLERPAVPRCICAVTRGFQTTTQDLSVFPFLPRHYHMTRVLLSPFITTAWTPVVLAIINII